MHTKHACYSPWFKERKQPPKFSSFIIISVWSMFLFGWGFWLTHLHKATKDHLVKQTKHIQPERRSKNKNKSLPFVVFNRLSMQTKRQINVNSEWKRETKVFAYDAMRRKVNMVDFEGRRKKTKQNKRRNRRETIYKWKQCQIDNIRDCTIWPKFLLHFGAGLIAQSNRQIHNTQSYT